METASQKPKQNWFKRALAKYDAFLKETGLDNSACRCAPRVPSVKQEPEIEKIKK